MQKKSLLTILCGTLIVTALANTVPSSLWPQTDRKEQDYGNPQAAHRVLIASRSSPFKDTVVNQVIHSLQQDSFYVKLIGIKKLSQYKPEKWSAIALVNTCMAWQGDNAVQDFIRKHTQYNAFILLTTSGDPDSCGSSKWIPPSVDAISSASEISRSKDVVEKLLSAIRQRADR